MRSWSLSFPPQRSLPPSLFRTRRPSNYHLTCKAKSTLSKNSNSCGGPSGVCLLISGAQGVCATVLSACTAGSTSTPRLIFRASATAGGTEWWITGGPWDGGGSGNGTDSSILGGSSMGDDGGGGEGKGEIGWGPTRNSNVPSECPQTFSLCMQLAAIWSLYATWLKESPFVANAVTAGILSLGGDLAAQWVEFQQSGGRGLLTQVICCTHSSSGAPILDLSFDLWCCQGNHISGYHPRGSLMFIVLRMSTR